VPSLARSASVREPPKSHVPSTAVVGGLTPKQGTIDPAAQEKQRAAREAKRRTVQLEYVPPQSSTTRGDGKTRARTGTQDPTEVVQDYTRQAAVPSSMPPPAERRPRDQPRAASETVAQTSYSGQRPSTGGSLSGAGLPSRGNSYGQPAVGVSAEEAHGRFSQPSLAQYNVSSPLPQEEGQPRDRRSYMGPDSFGQTGFPDVVNGPGARRSQAGHRRSNTVSGLSEKLFGFSKRGSMFGSKGTHDDEKARKPKKSHPPVSMKTPIPNDNNSIPVVAEPRLSTDSRRTSFSLGRKSSQNQANGQDQSKRSSRRFSFIPSFGRHDKDKDGNALAKDQRPKMAFGRGDSRSPSRSTTASSIPVIYNSDIDRQRNVSQPSARSYNAPVPYPEYPTSNPALQFAPNQDSDYYQNGVERETTPTPTSANPHNSFPDQHNALPGQTHVPQYPAGFNSYDEPRPSSGKHSVLQKQRRGFNDAYEGEGKHDGSSGAARRVMDFFRKRGKARAGD
jgi:protein-serine/threonine kinase